MWFRRWHTARRRRPRSNRSRCSRCRRTDRHRRSGRTAARRGGIRRRSSPDGSPCSRNTPRPSTRSSAARSACRHRLRRSTRPHRWWHHTRWRRCKTPGRRRSAASRPAEGGESASAQPTAFPGRTRSRTTAGLAVRACRHVANTRRGRNDGQFSRARRTLTRVGVFPYMPNVDSRSPAPGADGRARFFKNTRTSLEVST